MGNKNERPEDRSERGGGGAWRWRRGNMRGSGEGAYDVEVLLDVRKEMFVELERVVAVHAEPRRNAARDGAAAAEDARRLDDAPEDRRDEHEADALPLDQVDLDRDRSIDRQITAPPREGSWNDERWRRHGRGKAVSDAGGGAREGPWWPVVACDGT